MYADEDGDAAYVSKENKIILLYSVNLQRWSHQ